MDTKALIAELREDAMYLRDEGHDKWSTHMDACADRLEAIVKAWADFERADTSTNYLAVRNAVGGDDQ